MNVVTRTDFDLLTLLILILICNPNQVNKIQDYDKGGSEFKPNTLTDTEIV